MTLSSGTQRLEYDNSLSGDIWTGRVLFGGNTYLGICLIQDTSCSFKNELQWYGYVGDKATDRGRAQVWIKRYLEHMESVWAMQTKHYT